MVLGTPDLSKKYFHDKIESRLFFVAFPNSPDKIEVNDKSTESSQCFRKFWARVIFEDAKLQVILSNFVATIFAFSVSPVNIKKIANENRYFISLPLYIREVLRL